mmetsp:Transcript_5858/g.15611  ORF Transcript_5858/g.15611 Transcript_5858/m.15611 type:complete len:744 (-) Transcript_5858:180-2411(-)
MLPALLLSCLAAAGASPLSSEARGPWMDSALQPVERAKILVETMNLEEKIELLHGPAYQALLSCKNVSVDGPHYPECAYVGRINGNTRLGIPPINMNDGPQGFRDQLHPGTSTAWPSGLTMAASWDVNAMFEWGRGMGREFYEKGANVQLGPGLNIARVPQNGRNFEYLSGEDPFLGYTLAKPAVSGIQSQKVVANAKHFVLNSQETDRMFVSSEADERVRFEMYYPPFEGAIEAKVGSFMCSYNKVNRVWACENPTILAKELKGLLGFNGFVMSDWGATHSTSIMSGLDVEMPGGYYFTPELIREGLSAGVINKGAVDAAATRILTALFDVGVMDVPASTWSWKKLKNNVTSAASVASARRLSAVSTVLLKNDGNLLPLRRGKKLALLGFAGVNALVHSGGSGSVDASYVVTPLEGIKHMAGEGAEVHFNKGTDIGSAAALAAASDYAVVFVGTVSTEGKDRPSLSLDDGCVVDPFARERQCMGNDKNQTGLIDAVLKANPKTVVVASIPGAVLMPWSTRVPAILTNFMPGQQVGNAIADVLFGNVNPSAKLPITIPNHENETQFTQAQYPGLSDKSNPAYAYSYSYYSERLLVGYRYYDAHNIKFTTGFPFGHGLSYTTFAYSDLIIGSMKVSFTVRNSGQLPGAEVSQLYLGFPASAGEPPLQLKAFKKTRLLSPGESERMELQLKQRDFSIWDTELHSWRLIGGSFVVKVGSSSRDVRLQSPYMLAVTSPRSQDAGRQP